MGDAAGLGHHGKERVVRGAAALRRVVALERPFLRAVPFEHAGVEIEGVPRGPMREPRQAAGKERREGLRHRLRREPPEEAGEGRRAREPPEAEELAHGLIGPKHGELGEAAGPRQHPGEEGQEDLVAAGSRWAR